MKIDEAIKHAEEVVDGYEKIKKIVAVTEYECECAAEHRQLAEWLKELKDYKENLGQCKNCKYFEYDSMANVDGIPLIVAHEICTRWGDGCKSSENGFCFLFERKIVEPQESEMQEVEVLSENGRTTEELSIGGENKNIDVLMREGLSGETKVDRYLQRIIDGNAMQSHKKASIAQTAR